MIVSQWDGGYNYSLSLLGCTPLAHQISRPCREAILSETQEQRKWEVLSLIHDVRGGMGLEGWPQSSGSGSLSTTQHVAPVILVNVQGKYNQHGSDV